MPGNYPELVAPLIPSAQANRGADILLEGMKVGLTAAANFAQQRRQSEIEMLKLAAHERDQQDELAFGKEKLAQDYDLRTREIGVRKAYYDNMGRNRQMGIDFNLQRAALLDEVNQSAMDLRLNDPKFMTEHPVQYAKAVQDYEDQWQLSPFKEVKDSIKGYKDATEEQKLPLSLGMRYDERNKAWTGGSAPNPVPMLQIYKNLQNPLTQDQMMEDLRANNYTHLVDDFQKITGPGKYGSVTKEYKSKKEVLNSEGPVGKYLKDAEGVDFSKHLPARTPSVMLPKNASKGTSPTELPAPDLPELPPDASAQPASSSTPVFEPTKNDTILQAAKNAIAQGADQAAVANRLKNDFNIDPSKLWVA